MLISARARRLAGGVLAVFGLVALLAACGVKGSTSSALSANPSASADLAAGKHIATQIFYVCAQELGATVPKGTNLDTVTEPQALGMLTQPKVFAAITHPSGILRAYSCLKAHIDSHAQRHGVLECIKSGLLNMGSLTRAARDSAGQAIFSCSAGVLAS